MKIIKKNMKIAVLMLSLTLFFVSLGSISATEFDDTNSTIVSIDDNSQQNDLKEISIDDNEQEKEVLAIEEDEDVLGEAELSITDSSKTYSTSDSINLKLNSMWSSEEATVSVYLNDNLVKSLKYQTAKSGFAVPLNAAKSGSNAIYCKVPGVFGDETSNTVTFTVSGGSNPTPGTDPTASITIYDEAYPSNSTIYSVGDYVANIYSNLVKSGDGFSDESIGVFVNGERVGAVTPRSDNGIGRITINEDNEWDVYVVYTATVNGKTVTATSNTIKYITKNTSGVNPVNDTNGTSPDNPIDASASITIYDEAYPSNSTIYSVGDYVANIYSNLVKSGDGFTEESIDIFVNGERVGAVTPRSDNGIGRITINEDNEWDVYVVYTAAVGDKTVTATSNMIKYISKGTSGVNPVNDTNGTSPDNPIDASASITIYDEAYPSNSTIYSVGDYVARIYSNLVKSGDGFTEESIDIFVNGELKGTITPREDNGIGKITIFEDNEWNIYVVYTATVNGKTVTATSNTIKYVTKGTSGVDPTNNTNGTGGDTPQPTGDMQLIIRDVNNPNVSQINLNKEYDALLEYYVTVPSGSILSSELKIYCNGEYVTTVSNPSDRTYTRLSGTIPLNETGNYVFTAKYEYYVFMGETGEITGNSITYHVVLSDIPEPVKPTLEISIDDVTYPSQVIANVKSSVDGEYTIAIGQNTYDVSVSGGVGTTKFSLPAGNYTANIISKSDSTLYNSTSFEVKPLVKQNPSMQIDHLVYGNNVTISIKLPSDINGENVTVTLNGRQSKEATLKNGEGNVEFTGLLNADYSYEVVYNGDDKYNNVKDIKTFTIDFETPAEDTQKVYISITIEDVTYPSHAIANVKSSVDGDYTIIIGQNTYGVRVSDGNGLANFTLPAGNYTATVVSNSNSTIYNTTAFKVVKVDVIVDEALTISENADNTTFSIALPSDAKGTFSVTANGKTETKDLKNGKAEITLKDLPEGDNSVTISYSGDEKYGYATKTIIVNVKGSTNATGNNTGSNSTEPSGNNTGSDTNGTGSNSTDSTGNNTGSDTNGTGNNTDLNNGTSNHTGFSIVANDITRGFSSPYDFKATFYDKDGNALNKVEVTFIINGNDYNVFTDEYGVAQLVNALSVGQYNITMKNPATQESLVKNVTIVNRISNNNDINVDYSYSKTYKIRLFADNGQAVGANEAVIITFNNAKHNVLTDKNGYATFKIINMLPGTYSITAEYKGVKVSNKVVVKQILKAKNAKFKKSKKVKKYKVNLKTSSGKAISGKKITLKVKGKTYKAKTNKKGVATFKIKNLKKVGKFKATIKYLKTSIKKTITVRR